MKWFMMIVLVLFVSMVNAETYVWEPTNDDSNWHSWYNWDPWGIPTASDDAIINGLICNIFKPARANSITIGDIGGSGYLNLFQGGELWAKRIVLGEDSGGFGLLALIGTDTLVKVDEFIIGDRGNGSLVVYGGMVSTEKIKLHGIIDCSWGTIKTNSIYAEQDSLIVLRKGIICGQGYRPLDLHKDGLEIINYKDFAVLAEHWLERQ